MSSPLSNDASAITPKYLYFLSFMIFKNSMRKIWDSPTFTTWASFLSRPLNLILLTPLILTHLSEAETAVWLLFATFMSFQSLADFGFNSSLIRAYAHASGGAKTIKNFRRKVIGEKKDRTV